MKIDTATPGLTSRLQRPTARAWWFGFLLMLAVGCVATNAASVFKNWTGSASGYWSDPDNWDPTGVPRNGAILSFNDDVRKVMTNDLNNLSVAMGFLDHDFVLYGNPITLIDHSFLWNNRPFHYSILFQGQDGSTINIYCRLILGTNSAIHIDNMPVGSILFSTMKRLNLHGSIDLNHFDLSLNCNSSVTSEFGISHTHVGQIEISGAITGNGSFSSTVWDGCTLIFSGSEENTFSGELTLIRFETDGLPEPTISLQKQGVPVVKDRLVIQRAATVKYGQRDQIGDNAVVSLDNGSRLLLQNHSDTIGGLLLTNVSSDALATLVDTGGATLSVLGDLGGFNSSFSIIPTIQGFLDLPATRHTIEAIGSGSPFGLDLQAAISGEGGFRKTGSGTLLLQNDNNSFAGAVEIRAGIVEPGQPHALGDPAGPTILSGGRVLLRNMDLPDEQLVANQQPGSVLMSIGNSSWSGPVLLNTNLAVEGNMTFSGVISGTGGIGSSDGKTVRLTGNNPYTGANLFASSTLRVDGVQPLSAVDLYNVARLQGSGIVGNITVRGISPVIAPGNGPGILTCNNLDGAGNSGQLEIELSSTTPGSGYDQLVVNGTVNLTGLSLRGVRNFSPAQGDSFTIIANDGSDAVTGTFVGLRQDSQVRIGGESFHVNYAGGDGNDVVLTRLGHDITWTNNLSGDWNVAANWSPNLVPGSNDTVTIGKNVTVTLNTPVICYSLTMGLSSTLSGTGNLTSFLFNMNGFNVTGSQTVTVVHEMNWTSGSMSGTGRTVILPGAFLNLANVSVINLNGRTLENGGTIVWTSGNFGMSGGVITNRPGALFDARTTTGLNYASNPGSRFDNAGTFRKSVAGTTTLFPGLAFNNYGAVEIQAGTLTLFGGGTHTGTFAVPPGTTLNFSGGTHTANAGSSITGAGNFNVSGGNPHTLAGLVNVIGTNQLGTGTANVTGDYICTNNTLNLSGGTVNFNGTGVVSPAILNLGSSTLGGSQTIFVLGQMNWTGGTMTGNGRTIIPPGATLNIVASGSVVGLSGGRTLEIGGTALWTAGNFAMSSAVITNRAGAVFDVQSAFGLNYTANAGSRFDNSGTFRKSVNTGTTTFGLGMVFNNYNTVDLQAGILAANGGYNSTASSLLQCSLGGTTPGTGYARLQAAGTIPLNGALGVSLAPGFIPAANDAFTVVTATARNGTFTGFSYPADRVTMLMSNTPNSVVVRVTDVLPIPRPVLFAPQLLGTNTLLTWTTVSNFAYRLEFNPSLVPSNWNALAGDVVATSNTASKLEPLTTSNRFYRVRVLP